MPGLSAPIRELSAALLLEKVRLSSFLLVIVSFVLLTSSPVSAHFKLNLNIRVVHIEHINDGESHGLAVYLRLPMPYLLAHLLGPEQDDGERAAAPYTINTIIDGELNHVVDVDAVMSDPIGLGEFAAQGHQWMAEGGVLPVEVTAVRVHHGQQQPPFSSLQEAKQVFENSEQALLDPAVFVGDCVVDVLLNIRTTSSLRSYHFASTLNPGLDGQDQTANLILDYRGDDVLIFRETGLLAQPLLVSRSAWRAVRTFVVEGVRHILGGLDHVLFVVCLVAGAFTLRSLVWRITGFTLGHTVTLTLGFFGYTLKTPWFVPVVELGIAVSIIIAAVVSISDRDSQSTIRRMFIVTVLIGLLHGLGFSFVLSDILKISSPNLWQSLLAFNVGVEIGQLIIVMLIWPILWIAGRWLTERMVLVRWLLAIPCLAIASVWTGQRLIWLIDVI